MPRIDSLYAFVAEDTGPDDEGIVGAKTTEGWMPLVGADMARVKSLRPLAEGIARETGKTIKLLHFETRREVEIISKKGEFMAKAFILMEVAMGRRSEVVTALKKIDGVKSVDTVSGPYDVIATIEGATFNDIGGLTIAKIHPIAGIARTVSCLVV